ncbi:MAG: YccF domain-containing protein [Bacteroidales bacterium]|nr:YccF domain-containing protein [Bacteroidales bacterium]
MKFIGNLIWLILGGIVIAIIYYLVGLVICITIVGIPFGIQLFKLGSYAMWPFGRELVDGPREPGCLSIVMNLIWILLGWWEIALIHLACGLLFCITVVGIPWGIQHFKLALSSVFPFGKEIRGTVNL